MKKILGLDLGTNSIGWALINHDESEHKGEILRIGSRIIPMSQDIINDFGKGNKVSRTAKRTHFRSVRRLIERGKLRRRRLLIVLQQLGWLSADFDPVCDKIAYGEKNNFLFMNSYHEMVNEFKKIHGNNIAVPHDWTIYYLRKKGLTQKLDRTELAWVIMQFNKKRGYYELRSEEQESSGTTEDKEFVSEKVLKVAETGEKRKGTKVYEIVLENGITGQIQSREQPQWEGTRREFIATTRTLKDGSQTCSLTIPDPEDWTLRKKKTEKCINNKGVTVGEYIYHILLQDPYVKIRGKEVHTIERTYYREELKQILNVQKGFHEELKSQGIYRKCVELLYPNNVSQSNLLLQKDDFTWLFVNDIIFYQRPLKTKKSLISGCKYEVRSFLKENTIVESEVKCVARSNPWFQEYRLWSFIHNLEIFRKEEFDESGILRTDVNKTIDLLDENAKERIFFELNQRKEVAPSKILQILNLNADEFRMNYSEEVKIKGNETRALFMSCFKKCDCQLEGSKFLQDRKNEYRLWHAIYSLNTRTEILSALGNKELGFPEQAIEEFSLLPKFRKDYGSLSEKALKKIVPLMRCGNYWKMDEIDESVKIRIHKIIDGEVDPDIPGKVREKFSTHKGIDSFRSMRDFEAAYIVYGRHSETKRKMIYESPDDIQLLPQHSLRNPIVEQLTNETLKLVRDLWIENGRPDEIHIEMARELKLPAAKRKARSRTIAENERANLRARAMLSELKKDIPSINPFSIGQTDLFRLYEEGALQNTENLNDDIKATIFSNRPSASELIRYKLWLDQKYISPYTGNPISLADVFSTRCEIEHIIPRARYFDNSFNNKIICESEVNKAKDKMTAYEFICERGGMQIQLASGKTVCVLDKENYINLMTRIYRKGSPKYKNLMSYDIPESFIERQLNDTRYITKTIRSLLSPVVRKAEEEAEIPSGILTMPGQITSILKKDWGLEQVWKEIVEPRFIRLNEITGTDDYYEKSADGRSYILKNHEGLKRIDHRHHAMDALIVACTTRKHIIYINTLNNEKMNYALRSLLLKRGSNIQFCEPWQGFNREVFDSLAGAIVTFKTSNRILSRGNNYTWNWVTENGVKYKKRVKQHNENLWSIRQPLHKETVYGRITIRGYRIQSLATAIKTPETIADPVVRRHIKRLYIRYDNDILAIRKHLAHEPIVREGKALKDVNVIQYDTLSTARKMIDKTFTKKIIEEKVADRKIKETLLKHLASYNDDPEKAFCPQGIEEMNSMLRIPILRVRIYESMGKKFRLGREGNKISKYVEAAKGTNLAFVIFENPEGKRLIDENSSIPLVEVIERKKLRLPVVDRKPGYRWFVLSPGDTIYMPEPHEDTSLIDWTNLSIYQKERLYKCVSFSGPQCYFIPITVSEIISDKKEFGLLNKTERDTNERMIKNYCIKLEISRLGDMRPARYDSDKYY